MKWNNSKQNIKKLHHMVYNYLTMTLIAVLIIY